MQIVDRFHLHQNLLEAVRGLLDGNIPASVKIPVDTNESDYYEDKQGVKKLEDVDKHIQFGRLSPKKVKLYEEIHKLNEAGYSVRKIARTLNCSHHTIGKYLSGDVMSICSTSLSSSANKYHDQIVKSLFEGKCRSVLYRELKAIGLTCRETAAYDFFTL